MPSTPGYGMPPTAGLRGPGVGSVGSPAGVHSDRPLVSPVQVSDPDGVASSPVGVTSDLGGVSSGTVGVAPSPVGATSVLASAPVVPPVGAGSVPVASLASSSAAASVQALAQRSAGV
jgi:hypothetical protein